MFSDHGMNLEENRRVPLASTLRDRGFQVAIPAFGLCSYAALYCQDEDLIPEIARASVEVNGVDFESRYVKMNGSVLAYDYLVLSMGGRTVDGEYVARSYAPTLSALAGIESRVVPASAAGNASYNAPPVCVFKLSHTKRTFSADA